MAGIPDAAGHAVRRWIETCGQLMGQIAWHSRTSVSRNSVRALRSDDCRLSLATACSSL